MQNQTFSKGRLWLNHFWKALIFFGCALILLSLFRLAFVILFSNGITGISTEEYAKAFFVGSRLDAKWLATSLAPAFLLFLLSAWKPFFYKYSVFVAFLGLLVVVTLDAVNIGFYDFYKTPINPLVFGLFQDDTKAIFQTIWADWPVLTYLIAITAAVGMPFFLAYLVPTKKSGTVNPVFVCSLALLSVVVFVITMRGSISHFPLRQEDLAVSKKMFVNSAVINGPAALYEATKAWRSFRIKGNPADALHKFGYSSEAEAKKDLAVREPSIAKLPFRPNVVFAVMESMSADLFHSHDRTINNTLGSLEDALADALLFRKGVSIENGTFPSLEGLIFDTPLSPISQSSYGRKKLDFSQVMAFKNAGYRTIFLTGGPESWRQISDTFGFYGFEEIYGQAAIGEKFPEAEKTPWGIGDKWLFKFAEDLLSEAQGTGRPVFIMMLSTTNHPPLKVPDGEETLPVSLEKLPPFINKTSSYDGNMEMLLKTFQYAANSLGNFVLDLKKKGWLKNTIIAATGDHNARMSYPSENYWHHMFRVPIMLWLPKQANTRGVDTDIWVSHRDIFPTLVGLAVGEDLGNTKGRNLLSAGKEEGAVSFIGWAGDGFVIGKPGMVTISGSKLTCYDWKEDKLIRSDRCTKEQEQMGKEARAQRALAEYEVRKGLMTKSTSSLH